MPASKSFYFMNHIIWWMICGYLLIDSLTGLILLYTGIDTKLSLLFKAPLILMMLSALLVLSHKHFAIVLAILSCFLLGPLFQVFVSGNVSYFFNDFSYALKFTMPILVYVYCSQLVEKFPYFYDAYITKALYMAAAIIVLNLTLGLVGFGYSTYGNNESGLGVSGFFTAGNELGGLLVIASVIVLHKCWNKGLFTFILFTLVALFLAISVATKTAVLAVILASVSIPIVNERERIFKFTRLKLYYFVTLLVCLPLASYKLYSILTETDLFTRLTWAFDTFGIMGLIFSGRQEFIQNSIAVFAQNSSIFELFFGLGVSGVVSDLAKYSAEVDPIDVLVWFGFIGVSIMVALTLYFIREAFYKLSNNSYYYAPAVLIGNLLLLIVACFSGHIWTSGMLGISWGVMNALMLKKQIQNT